MGKMTDIRLINMIAKKKVEHAFAKEKLVQKKNVMIVQKKKKELGVL